jgi:hypothetical protein
VAVLYFFYMGTRVPIFHQQIQMWFFSCGYRASAGLRHDMAELSPQLSAMVFAVTPSEPLQDVLPATKMILTVPVYAKLLCMQENWGSVNMQIYVAPYTGKTQNNKHLVMWSVGVCPATQCFTLAVLYLQQTSTHISTWHDVYSLQLFSA